MTSASNMLTMRRRNHVRALQITLWLLISAPAAAEWVKYDGNDMVTAYVDPATLEVEGHLRRAATLVDLNQRDKSGAMSTLGRVEVDCKEERWRLLSGTFYRERMAAGDTIAEMSISKPSEWVYIWRGVSDRLLTTICAVR